MAFTSPSHAGVHDALGRRQRELEDWSRRLHGGPAGYLARTGAAMLDFFVWLPVEVALLWALRGPLGLEDGDLALSFFPAAGYRNGLWVSTAFVQFGFAIYLSCADAYGGSVGKRLMRLRVINHESGLHLGLWRSFMRQLIARTVSALCYLGFFVGLFDQEKRMLHDQATGAQVVRRRQTETVAHL